MSALEKRLQVLVDAERFARLSHESQATGRSIGAIVREGIDLRVPPGGDVRAKAASFLLTHADDPVGSEPEPDWAETKQALEADMAARLP